MNGKRPDPTSTTSWRPSWRPSTPPVSASLGTRVARALVAVHGRLPRLAHRVIGGRPIVVQDQALHPEVQAIVRMLNAVPDSDFADLPVEEGRALIDREASLFGGSPLAHDLELLTIPTDTGGIPARLYRPKGARPRGLVVYFHGGGWVLGSLDSSASTCAFLAHHAEVSVLAVDYRLAPEHKFPAGVDDALAAFRFAVANAEELGVDPAAIAVAGDSAGGNLAAVVAQATAHTGEQQPALQVLIVPVTDLSQKRESYRLFADGFFLTEKHMDWYQAHYLGDPAQATDPRVSPLLAENLTGLPPAYVVVAGFDPLRDEGIAYAERLRQAGVATELQVQADLVHPFTGALGGGPRCREATREVADAIKAALNPARVR